MFWLFWLLDRSACISVGVCGSGIVVYFVVRHISQLKAQLEIDKEGGVNVDSRFKRRRYNVLYLKLRSLKRCCHVRSRSGLSQLERFFLLLVFDSPSNTVIQPRHVERNYHGTKSTKSCRSIHFSFLRSTWLLVSGSLLASTLHSMSTVSNYIIHTRLGVLQGPD